MRRKLLLGTLVGMALVGAALVGLVMAETPSPSAHAALTGKVTSQAEGAMEGVIVGAKKAGSTITTWVVSNAQGQYSFPRARLQPGKYAISVRAAGYELGHALRQTSVDVTAQAAQRGSFAVPRGDKRGIKLQSAFKRSECVLVLQT